jgi:glycosyltransferase involved in cell wall biosynthesis
LSRRLPVVATIHHPITVDRAIAIRSETSLWKKIKQWRWYSFIGMQKRVAPALHRIITVSKRGRNDIHRTFNIAKSRISVAPNGIDTDSFYPLPGIERESFRLITTTSADTPLKGLGYLLQAMAELSTAYPRLHLVVVGQPRDKSPIPGLIAQLGLNQRVRFTGRINQQEYVRQYARAWAAVVPSVYEGFGLPAGEAMACGVPVISTSGGALPEVVGNAGQIVPPKSHHTLARAIARFCDHPELAKKFGRAGYERITTQFTWEQAARKTAAAYYQAIHDYRRHKNPGSARP